MSVMVNRCFGSLEARKNRIKVVNGLWLILLLYNSLSIKMFWQPWVGENCGIACLNACFEHRARTRSAQSSQLLARVWCLLVLNIELVPDQYYKVLICWECVQGRIVTSIIKQANHFCLAVVLQQISMRLTQSHLKLQKAMTIWLK